MRRVKCQNCKEKVEKGSRFCPNCGAPMVDGSAAAAKERAAVTLWPEEQPEFSGAKALKQPGEYTKEQTEEHIEERTEEQPLREMMEEPQPAIGLEKIPDEEQEIKTVAEEETAVQEPKTELTPEAVLEALKLEMEAEEAGNSPQPVIEAEEAENPPQPAIEAEEAEKTPQPAIEPERVLEEQNKAAAETEPENIEPSTEEPDAKEPEETAKTKPEPEPEWSETSAEAETRPQEAEVKEVSELSPGAIIEMPRAEAAVKGEHRPEAKAEQHTNEESETGKKRIKKVRTKASFGKVLASVLLSVLAFFLGTGACLAFFVRNATTEGAIRQTVDRINLGRIGVGFIEGQDAEAVLLEEYVADRFTTTINPVRSENARTLLNERFVKDFVVEKVNRYIEDILVVTKDGEVRETEIIELIDDNWRTVKRDLDLDSLILENIRDSVFKEELLTMMERRLRRDIDFEAFSIPTFRRHHNTAFQIVRTVLSYPAIIGMAVLFLVFVILLIVMNFRYRGGFRYAGTVFILMGIVDLLIAEAALVMPVVLNSMIGLGYEFYIAVLSNFIAVPFMFGAGALIIGIVFSMVGRELRKGYKKKVAAVVEEPSRAA